METAQAGSAEEATSPYGSKLLSDSPVRAAAWSPTLLGLRLCDWMSAAGDAGLCRHRLHPMDATQAHDIELSESQKSNRIILLEGL